MNCIAQRAVELAASLATAAVKEQTSAERAEAARLASMMNDPTGRAFTLELADRVFRSRDRAAQAERLRAAVRRFGVPKFLTLSQRLLLSMAAKASNIASGMVMPLVEAQLRRSSGRVILSAEPAQLKQYLAARRAAGTRVNLNHLGEAVLGEEEASRRMQAVLAQLANPAVGYVSVKISAIYSQIHILDWDATLAVVKDRLRALYLAAKPTGKFINLDMEEYRDLEMTVAAFQQVLDEPEFHQLAAGLALQAYIPDSWAVQRRLTEWARQRVAAGGAAIKIRLVKGANLAMEAVEAELHGWNAAPYSTKVDTDANYRRMLEYGCQPDNAAAVRLGVASHNLFDVALALVLRDEMNVVDRVELEMIEGMANHQARAVQKVAGGLLVYAPVVKREDFFSAMAYLVRRLDENTAPQNFLHDLFDMTVGDEAWERQKRRFIDGWEKRNAAPERSRRGTPRVEPNDGFQNAPDTDWTQLDRRDALYSCLRERRTPEPPAPNLLDDVLTAAQAGQGRWGAFGYADRAAILRRCADVMERNRFATISQMVNEAKKAAVEADVEVSEAVDFARYYAATPPPPGDVRATPLGVVVVAPPWNFPYAIPCGGILAALMAGNAVVLKPAPETVGVAWRLAQHLWEGGVPPDVLQFFPCPDGDIGRSLITDSRVAAVVLTGAYETARMFLDWRPTLRLFAETSGKNAIIVTRHADRDLAIKDLVKSAFGHAGQKCSAASLGILEAEVYDDPHFQRSLRDAAASLKVGPAADLGSVVTPLIREPSQNLRRALTTLDPGERWLLEPRGSADDPCLWPPGIKLGVKPGSWFHQTECFGPVLGLMRAANLDEAIQFQNDTAFGLTGGIHSLDDGEVARWRDDVQVGNAYVNRAITGAVVRRQPFGGWKRSSLGPGAKAGGPNYVAMFAQWEDANAEVPDDYDRCWRETFALEHDPSKLTCESNVFRHRPCRGVVLRVERDDAKSLELARRAAEICGVPLHISVIEEEMEAQLAARLPALSQRAEFLRTLRPPGDALLAAAYEARLNWIDAPLSARGRYELPRWLREQAVSTTLHRYGLPISMHDGPSRGL